ncbi:MAG: hypothetical protein HY788_05680 [Deltaproteobacteria bacterium]|nr:hypothetical protein [Deltaproteobacteria bacterium]
MKKQVALVLLFCFTLACGAVLFEFQARAQEAETYKVDKEKCALLIRYGKDALDRARYEEAKYYFQTAVQTDPYNPKPWNWYDLASFYAAADQMKKEGKYMVRPTQPAETPALAPGASEKETMTAPAAPQPPAAPPAAPQPAPKFKIGQDEGC